jgi:acrylyl-CoA reductase (NADPH)
LFPIPAGIYPVLVHPDLAFLSNIHSKINFMKEKFRALMIVEDNGIFKKEIKELSTDELTSNELLVNVHYSSVNYKDSLSASGNRSITRKYPHIPGIDAAGVIVRSSHQSFSTGDRVIVTGFDLGMNTWGGFGEYISVPAAWALKLPHGLTMREAMAFGTAGLTAGLSVQRLVTAGLSPGSGKIVVSGSTGGVGSMAVAILSKLGYDVLAISGKQEDTFLLETLGATATINRNGFISQYNNKPMAATAFAGGIDTVGGEILSGMLKSTAYGGIVTTCGMVGGTEVETSIFPFILRGLTLAGIDSVLVSLSEREIIWSLLAHKWKPENLDVMFTEISLHQLPEKLELLIKGQAKGRFLLTFE